MINKEIKICILGGGWSNEREISLKSSNDVYSCLRKNNHNVIYYDMVSDSASKLEIFLKENSVELVFNLIHGEGGEDGTVQSYLDSFGIAYCGSGTESSKISFNKYQTKRIWSDNNLSTPDYEIYNSQSYDYCKEKYGTSFFIKDTCSGSSNNIFLISNSTDYDDFINKFDVDKVALTNDEILNAIEDSLKMQGRGETEIEPRTHIRPRAGVEGHFNVLRGWIGGEIDSVGTKVSIPDRSFINSDCLVNFLALEGVIVDMSSTVSETGLVSNEIGKAHCLISDKIEAAVFCKGINPADLPPTGDR